MDVLSYKVGKKRNNTRESSQYEGDRGECPIRAELTGEVLVNRGESVELVLEQVLVLVVEETKIHAKPTISLAIPSQPPPRTLGTHALINLEPSTPTLVLFPTISEGKTRSSKIFSWTAVNVLDRGRF